MGWDQIKRFLIGSAPMQSDPQGEPTNGSKNIETRRSRVRVARDTLRQLVEMASDYPFIKLERLADVERDIDKIDAETDQLELR